LKRKAIDNLQKAYRIHGNQTSHVLTMDNLRKLGYKAYSLYDDQQLRDLESNYWKYLREIDPILVDSVFPNQVEVNYMRYLEKK
jgi:hypothetical protein